MWTFSRNSFSSQLMSDISDRWVSLPIKIWQQKPFKSSLIPRKNSTCFWIILNLNNHFLVYCKVRMSDDGMEHERLEIGCTDHRSDWRVNEFLSHRKNETGNKAWSFHLVGLNRNPIEYGGMTLGSCVWAIAPLCHQTPSVAWCTFFSPRRVWCPLDFPAVAYSRMYY